MYKLVTSATEERFNSLTCAKHVAPYGVMTASSIIWSAWLLNLGQMASATALESSTKKNTLMGGAIALIGISSTRRVSFR